MVDGINIAMRCLLVRSNWELCPRTPWCRHAIPESRNGSRSLPRKGSCTRVYGSICRFPRAHGHEIGRIVKHLRKIGQLDNTVIMISVGDNGGSKEGTTVGVINSLIHRSQTSRCSNTILTISIRSERSFQKPTIRWVGRWRRTRRSVNGSRMPTRRRNTLIHLLSFIRKGISKKAAFAISTVT